MMHAKPSSGNKPGKEDPYFHHETWTLAVETIKQGYILLSNKCFYGYDYLGYSNVNNCVIV